MGYTSKWGVTWPASCAHERSIMPPWVCYLCGEGSACDNPDANFPPGEPMTVGRMSTTASDAKRCLDAEFVPQRPDEGTGR